MLDAHWAVAILTFGVVVAGIVTYYWVASTPGGSAGAASVPSVILGTFCCLPFILGIFYLLAAFSTGAATQSSPGVPQQANQVLQSLVVIVIATFLSVIAAFTLFWSFSRIGEWAFKRSQPDRPVALYLTLGCCLVGVATVLQIALALGIFLATGLLPSAMGTFGYLFFPMIAGGWLFGLVIGDFAASLQQARSARAVKQLC